MRAAFRKLATLTPLAWGFFVGSAYAQETPYYNPATGGYYQSVQEACVSAVPAVTDYAETNASSSRQGQTLSVTYSGYYQNCQYTYSWSGGGGGTGAMNTAFGISAAKKLAACAAGETKTSSVPVGRLIDGVYTDFGSYYTSKKCYSGCEAVFNGGGGITYVTPGDGNNYVYEDLEYELTGATCSADSADPSFTPPASPDPEPDPEPETPTDPETSPDPDDGGGTGGTGGGTGGGSGGDSGGIPIDPPDDGLPDPTDPTDPTDPVDPTDPDPTDPPVPGDTSGSQDAATSADIRSLGDRITGAISSAYDRLASAISGVRNDLQGMSDAIGDLSGPEWGADGGLDDGSGIGEMGGELGGGIVEGLNTATDDAIASRDGELQDALDGIAGQVEDWFGDKGSKIDPDNLLGFLPREASCSDIPISVKLGKEDANFVIPVCSLSSVKEILKWVFYALTIIGIWKILMNGMIVSARGGKGR